MRISEDSASVSVEALRVVVRPGAPAPAHGTYRCLCCGVVLWRLRRGRPLPDCPTTDCPTMWLWSEP
jgi:hypothetical protein